MATFQESDYLLQVESIDRASFTLGLNGVY